MFKSLFYYPVHFIHFSCDWTHLNYKFWCFLVFCLQVSHTIFSPKGAFNLTNRKFVVLQHCRSNDSKRCFIYDKELGSVSECGIQEGDIVEEFLENRISFRLQANIPLFIGKDYKVCCL